MLSFIPEGPVQQLPFWRVQQLPPAAGASSCPPNTLQMMQCVNTTTTEQTHSLEFRPNAPSAFRISVVTSPDKTKLPAELPANCSEKVHASNAGVWLITWVNRVPIAPNTGDKGAIPPQEPNFGKFRALFVKLYSVSRVIS